KPDMPFPELVAKAKNLLETSANPVIISWRGGRHPQWYRSIANFADTFAIPVINYAGEVVNYPASGNMAIDRFDLSRADLIMVIEDEVPWIPKDFDPSVPVIRIDSDPFFTNIPYYGIGVTLSVRAGVSDFLDVLRPNINREVLEDRRHRISEMHLKQLKDKSEEIRRLSKSARIHPRYLSDEIGKLKVTMITEYQIDPRYAMPEEFGSYFATPSAGYLGLSLGAGVGYSMATGKDVVIGTGDGAFIFGVPSAFGYIAHDQPVLCAIYDNGGWLASSLSVNDLFPDGMARKSGRYPGADLKRYSIGKVIESFGGSYMMIEDPGEVRDALREGLKIIREERRPAVIQFVVEASR
ncbi:MAG TPA: thiamine pyrophosphate-dependent enzyme, partial [Thermoplasmataceae archaeon]|nr:thiamine pyrophosphate-dependent enzyme [Thermoplasmataceae archaeon]